MNTSKCSKCGYSVIAEEVSHHECKDVIDYRIEGKTLWLFDGEIWYPRKLTRRKFTDEENRRRFDRTVKQYSYKVLVPYHTVW